ncbi:MAG: hypothetical protein HGA82_00110 [Anaerolineales bacterium]|nr:hypothetical protein [Anaerolineales bacterium]
MKKTLQVLVVLVLICTVMACNITVPTPTPTLAPTSAPTATPESDPVLVGPPGWLTYTDTYNRFSIMYPPEGTLVQEAMLHIDLPVSPGTNLREKYLQIEFTPAASPCHTPQGNGFEPGTIPQTPVTINGIEFILEEGSDAGAGNYYQWSAYSVFNGSICISFDFMLHSTNPDNYDPPLPRFDQVLEAAIFVQMMETFRWLPGGG